MEPMLLSRILATSIRKPLLKLPREPRSLGISLRALRRQVEMALRSGHEMHDCIIAYLAYYGCGCNLREIADGLRYEDCLVASEQIERAERWLYGERIR